jgi:hypothetical protein
MIPLVASDYVFGNVRDAAAAQTVSRTGMMMVSDVAFDLTWLLRPSSLGMNPSEFGAKVDVSRHGVVRFAALGEPPISPEMRLIAKVTFS